MSVPGRLADFTRRAVTGGEPTPGQQLYRGALALASLGYAAGVWGRNRAYDLGLLPVHRLSCRVVCIGNLTVGGTGKTPMVITLAKLLADAGSKICILLRGYGRSGTSARVVSDGRGLRMGWREAGDEAIHLARRLPGVPVLVGADRVDAGRLALRQFGPGTILLDDGFQHRRLYRDADLVLLDGTDPFGGERLLPRGLLREPTAGLRRAHAVVVTRSDQAMNLDLVGRRLREVAPRIPMAWAVHRPRRLVELPSGQEQPPETVQGHRVLAVSGIANPQGFHQTLRGLGATLVGTLTFPDHHPFTPEDRARMGREAKAAGATWIVTTEKDAVRLDEDLSMEPPILALGIELEVVRGTEVLEGILGIALRGTGRG